MTRTAPIYYISPSVISIVPNCNDSANDLAVNLANDAKIKIYAKGNELLDIDPATNSFREWALAGRNRRLSDSSKPYTIYARLSKGDNSKGYLVFAAMILVDEKWVDRYGNTPTPEAPLGHLTYYPDQAHADKWYISFVGDYYFVRLGEVSLPDEMNKRTVSLDTGILGTDQFNMLWGTNSDSLPNQIRLECLLDGEACGISPYVPWGKSLQVKATLLKGWEQSQGDTLRWEILRSTGNPDTDSSWNENVKIDRPDFAVTGNITLNHMHAAEDDFDQNFASTFTIKAFENNLLLVETSLTALAETVGQYQLKASSLVVKYNYQSDSFQPDDGVRISVLHTDQKGRNTFLTNDLVEKLGLTVKYRLANSVSWTPLYFGGSPEDLAEAKISTSVFTAKQNVETTLFDANSRELSSALISFVDDLAQYTVDFSEYVDVITVDDVGNVIGGLYSLDQEGKKYDFRINAAIQVRRNGELLVLADDDEAAGEGTYKIHAEPVGCSCIISNSTVYITGIDYCKDGVAGSDDDLNFDYDAMRAADSCYINLIVDCEGKTVLVKNFPVTIKHDSQPYVDAGISNEISGISWITKLQKYIGLPVVFDVWAWHNNEPLDITTVDNVSIATGTSGITLVNGAAPTTPAATSIYYDKAIVTVAKNQGTADEFFYKICRITITAVGKDVPRVSVLNIACVVKYSGINYERNLVHTISKSSDTNVYSLLPRPTEIVVNKNAGTMTDDTVFCDVLCDSSDEKHFQVFPADFGKYKLALTYRLFYIAGGSGDETIYTPDSGVRVDSDVTIVRFYLYGLNDDGTINRSVKHDEEGVEVISNGLDGKGVEYIFIVKDDWDGKESGKPTLVDVEEERQVDNYCPYTDAEHTDRWTDEPTGVAANARYEFYAQRKKVNGVWQAFGTVKLWDRYAMDGVSPYIIDLSNEQSFIGCNEDGSLLPNVSYEPSDLMLLLGAKNAFTDFDTIKITPTNISCNGQTVAFTLTSADKEAAQTSGYYRLNPDNIASDADAATIGVTAIKNDGLRLSAVYKINKNRAGKNGVIYSLVPSLNVIHKNIDTQLSVQVNKTVGDSTTELTTKDMLDAEGVVLTYQGSHESEQPVNQLANLSVSMLCGSALFTKIYLRKNGVLLDSERINVISDGKNADFHNLTARGTRYDSVTSMELLIDEISIAPRHPGRGLTLTVLDPDLSVVQQSDYDVYDDGTTNVTTATDRLMEHLTNYGTSDRIIILTSNDAIYIHDRLWAKLACEYGVGRDLRTSARRRAIAIISQKGMRPGQALVEWTDTDDYAEVCTSVASGTLCVLGKDEVPVYQNLLEQTDFNLISAWTQSGGALAAGDYDGSNAWCLPVRAGTAQNYIQQQVTNKLKTDTWYTLSFCGRGGTALTMIYPGIINTSEKCYIDGVSANGASNGLVAWTLDDVYRKHTFTFKTLSSFDGTGYVRWHTSSSEDTGTVWISQPKLEEGVWSTAWQTTQADRKGLAGCRERLFQKFSASQTYLNEEHDLREGVRYVDFLAFEDSSYNSGYRVYRCLQTHTPMNLGYTTFEQCLAAGLWTLADINTATAFFTHLIAMGAHIRMLSSSAFLIVDDNNNVVAGFANTQTPIWAGASSATDAPFYVTSEGEVHSTSGFIGGFTIATDRLYNVNYSASIEIGTSSTKKVILGDKAKGAMTTQGENAIMRAENTENQGTTSDTYNTALYLAAKGAKYNYALYGVGNGVLNGVLVGYKYATLNMPGGNDTVTLQSVFNDGTTQLVVGNHSDGFVKILMPTLKDVKLSLGIRESDMNSRFAVEMTYINATSYEFVQMFFRNADDSMDNKYPYLVRADGANAEGDDAKINLTAGGVFKFVLFFSGTYYRAFRISYYHV